MDLKPDERKDLFMIAGGALAEQSMDENDDIRDKIAKRKLELEQKQKEIDAFQQKLTDEHSAAKESDIMQLVTGLNALVAANKPVEKQKNIRSENALSQRYGQNLDLDDILDRRDAPATQLSEDDSEQIPFTEEALQQLDEAIVNSASKPVSDSVAARVVNSPGTPKVFNFYNCNVYIR